MVIKTNKKAGMLLVRFRRPRVEKPSLRTGFRYAFVHEVWVEAKRLVKIEDAGRPDARGGDASVGDAPTEGADPT